MLQITRAALQPSCHGRLGNGAAALAAGDGSAGGTMGRAKMTLGRAAGCGLFKRS